MDHLPFVSVIIPVRNASAFLDELLKALYRQTWPAERRELIFIDNGSTDGTPLRLAREGEVILLSETGRTTPYAARNRGIEAARGEIFALTDANKIPDPQWLEQGVKTLVEEEADLVGGEILFDLPAKPGIAELVDAMTFNDNRTLVLDHESSTTGNLFFNRKIWVSVGSFSEQYRSGMDIRWTHDAVARGHRLAFAENAVVRCKPRNLRGVLRKAFRVGKVHPLNMKYSGESTGRIILDTARTFFWPSPAKIRRKMQDLHSNKKMTVPVQNAHRSLLGRVWTGVWLMRIAMGTGRASALPALMAKSSFGKRGGKSSEKKLQTIGFFYYNFYPVTGGASVHGYHLAKELSRLGYRLLKLNGAADPWTEKVAATPSGLLRILRKSDLFYVRMDYFLKLRNLIGALCILTGRQTVVELNAPSDELRLFNRGERAIRRVDRIYSALLRRASAVIVVSEGIRDYCVQGLGLENVHLIENGGEVFREDELRPDPALVEKVERFCCNAEKRVIWVGSPNAMQELDWLKPIVSEAEPDTVFLIIYSYKKEDAPFLVESENLLPLTNLTRDEIGWLITRSNIGLAFYRKYSGSRWGIYNSSLKLYEYLNNGLLTLTNLEGTSEQYESSCYRKVETPHEASEAIRNYRPAGKECRPIRTWADVASDTNALFRIILKQRP